MNACRWCVVGSLLVIGACQPEHGQKAEPTAVSVNDPVTQPENKPDLTQQKNTEKTAVPVTEAHPMMTPGGDVNDEWLGRLRTVCRDIEAPESRKARKTSGSATWKDKVKVTVKDFRLYSPNFKKWTLAKVDNSFKSGSIRHRGPFYGYGLTVEMTNNSDQVLTGDSVYVWATFKSKTGERVCYAAADASRSWNPFAKKGLGAWEKEREFSEWPLRPGERKRYTVSRTSCPVQMFLESEPTDVSVEVYASFRPLGGDRVVAGPVVTLSRDGALLRGVPLADSAKVQQRIGRRGISAVKALYAAGDHVLISESKKVSWIPVAELAGRSPTSPLKTEALPSKTAPYSQQYGSLSIQIDNWRVEGWKSHAGKVKQGHKVVKADVSVSIDSSSVQQQLTKAVETAQSQLVSLQQAHTEKQAALEIGKTMLVAAKGTEGEGPAKAAVKEAQVELKQSKKVLKQAQKALKSAEKAMGGGLNSFLKTQAKAVDCGSFKLDVGRKQLKPMKGSMGKKDCKVLTGGLPVTGTIAFDLERWDMPFLLMWKSTGGGIETHRVGSKSLGTILKD